jgi:hypothetical protein
MYSITGLSTFYGGTLTTPPAFRIALGNSEQSDAVAPFDINEPGQHHRKRLLGAATAAPSVPVE